MKTSLLSATAIALALSAGSALAADLPSRKEAPVYIAPAPPPLWTGLYGGLNIGGGWANNGGANNTSSAYYDTRGPLGGPLNGAPAGVSNMFFLPDGNSLGAAGGVLGGAQVGYNMQFNQFVLGVETDFQGTSISSSGGNGGGGLYPAFYNNANGNNYLTSVNAVGGANANLSWFGTVRGRIGFLITPTLLIYGTGGFAYGQVDAWGFSSTNTGWTGGGGVEWLFAPHWSAKVEYLYVNLSGSNSLNNSGYNFGYNYNPGLNVVRAGINYHFNWDAPAPILAKY
jgi:outer membrane immunogenic protein